MPAIVDRHRKASGSLGPPPPLENGDRLSATEFLRRYEAMSDLKKAELIEGIVYMPSPVSVSHAKPDSILQTWLGMYSAATPGVECYTNVTAILGPRNTLQPDACLCLKPGAGGQVRLNAKRYLVGAPELVAEITTSSVSLDLGRKKETYAAAGVREYLVWRTQERAFDWFVLEDAQYLDVAPDRRGMIQSRIFPGLALHLKALLSHEAAKVLAHLQRGLASAAHKAFVDSLR